MKLLFLTIFTISICVEARIFPAKNSEPLLDASSPQSSLSAGLSSTQLASLLLSSPNYAPQLRRLFGLDVQQQQQSPQSAAAGNPSIVYPAVAVDEDGDGSVDLWMINQQTLPFGDEAQQQPLPNNNMPLPYAAVGYNINRRIVGRQINGQPVKVYQHQRTIHFPTTENHYVQRTAGPAIETDVVKDVPIGSLEQEELKNLRNYGPNSNAHLLLRNKRQVDTDEDGDDDVEE